MSDTIFVRNYYRPTLACYGSWVIKDGGLVEWRKAEVWNVTRGVPDLVEKGSEFAYQSDIGTTHLLEILSRVPDVWVYSGIDSNLTVGAISLIELQEMLRVWEQFRVEGGDPFQKIVWTAGCRLVYPSVQSETFRNEGWISVNELGRIVDGGEEIRRHIESDGRMTWTIDGRLTATFESDSESGYLHSLTASIDP